MGFFIKVVVLVDVLSLVFGLLFKEILNWDCLLLFFDFFRFLSVYVYVLFNFFRVSFFLVLDVCWFWIYFFFVFKEFCMWRFFFRLWIFCKGFFKDLLIDEFFVVIFCVFILFMVGYFWEMVMGYDFLILLEFILELLFILFWVSFFLVFVFFLLFFNIEWFFFMVNSFV